MAQRPGNWLATPGLHPGLGARFQLGENSPSKPVGSASNFDATNLIHDNGVAIKPGTNVRSLDVHMAPAITVVASETRNLGLTAPTLTSAQDRHHTDGSLHPDGKALDFRGRNITIAEGRALAGRVSQRLGPNYDVQFETFPNNPANNHLHTEYDPKPPRKSRGRK